MLHFFVKGFGSLIAKNDSKVKDLLCVVGADSLYYGGRLLDPMSTLYDLKIPTNATLESSRRLRGGNLFKLIGSLLKLIVDLVKIVVKIVMLITKPAQCIMLIIALCVVSVLYVVYFVLTLPPFIWIVAAIWYTLLYIVPMIAYCIIFTILLVAGFVLSILLYAINTMSAGALKNIVLCDSSPSAWYNIPNFHFKNKWERGIMCTKPCPARYRPNATGSSCEVIPKGYPPYCPQAEAMRIFTRKKADKKYIFKKFNESINTKYMLKTPSERETMLKDYYMNRKTFSDTCSLNMSGYDNISLSICVAADSLKEILNETQIAKLKQVCAQAYCTTQRNYPFCSKTSDLNDNDANAVIKKVVKIVMIIITIILTITLAMTFMYNNVTT